jgi:hypothetical protein
LNRLKRNDKDSWKDASRVCQKTFDAFVEFSRSGDDEDRDDFLLRYKRMNEVLNTSRRNSYSKSKMIEASRIAEETVKSKGWERCGCTACRLAGAHIALVRGPRIPYTFLHNTHVMFVRLKRELVRARKEVVEPPFDWSQVRELNRIKNVRRSIRKED